MGSGAATGAAQASPVREHNSKTVKLLGEPSGVWRNFEALARIPRKSGNEAGVLEMLRGFAEERGLQCTSDAAGNTVIRRPGGGGGEGAPTVVLQNHVDMVCVKGPNSVHDFASDPVKLVLDGGWGEDWLTADDTTLGSDNGLGAAMALSVLSLPPQHRLPPIEALFTVDEETGLTGCQKLDPSIVTGRTLVNLDTEQWGEICVGSAGTGTSEIRLPVARLPEGEAAAAAACSRGALLSVEVGGLLGGHSGSDIKRDRANAIKLLSRAASAVSEAAEGTLLAELSGGDLRNSIPKHARGLLVLPEGADEEAAEAALKSCEAAFKAEYGAIEKSLALDWELRRPSQDTSGEPAAPMDATSSRRVLQLLSCIPHGVHKYSHSIEGLPETSCNLAVASVTEDELVVTTTTRSSIPAAMESVRAQMRAVAELCGGSMEARPAYSGWQPNLESPLLKVTKAAYAEVLGREPVVKASHAGLECGVLCGLLPGSDAVSIGPEIRGAHSVDERAQVSTVKPCYDLVLKVLDSLSYATTSP